MLRKTIDFLTSVRYFENKNPTLQTTSIFLNYTRQSDVNYCTFLLETNVFNYNKFYLQKREIYYWTPVLLKSCQIYARKHILSLPSLC